jgi:hypothetical protein
MPQYCLVVIRCSLPTVKGQKTVTIQCRSTSAAAIPPASALAVQAVAAFVRPHPHVALRGVWNAVHHNLGRVVILVAWVTMWLGVAIGYEDLPGSSLARWLAPIAGGYFFTPATAAGGTLPHATDWYLLRTKQCTFVACCTVSCRCPQRQHRHHSSTSDCCLLTAFSLHFLPLPIVLRCCPFRCLCLCPCSCPVHHIHGLPSKPGLQETDFPG